MSNKFESISAILADLDMQDYNKAYAAATALTQGFLRGNNGSQLYTDDGTLEFWSNLVDGIYLKMKKDREAVLSKPVN
jgi:hypothetical protein